jgi:peptidoglycan hydrolase CwlO-like protein
VKTKITTIILAALAAVSICLAQSVGNFPKPDKTPPPTAQQVHADLQKTQAELQQALTRIAVLEKQVSSLQQANARLELEIKSFGQPRLVPLERKSY